MTSVHDREGATRDEILAVAWLQAIATNDDDSEVRRHALVAGQLCERALRSSEGQSGAPSEAAIRAATEASGFANEDEPPDAMLLRAVGRMLEAAYAIDGIRGAPREKTPPFCPHGEHTDCVECARDRDEQMGRASSAAPLGEPPSNPTLEAIRDFAQERVTLARCAELLGVNIADAQFLRPLCPAVYSREDFAAHDGSSWDCPECGTNVTGPSVAPQCPKGCGPMARSGEAVSPPPEGPSWIDRLTDAEAGALCREFMQYAAELLAQSDRARFVRHALNRLAAREGRGSP